MAFFACVLAVAMGSCDKNDDPKVPDLKCTPSKVEVAPGKTATVTVSGGTAPFTVTSSNTKIATAKADKNTITITGLKDGTATMLISDSKKLTGKIPVVVKAAASGLDFDKKSVSVTVGKEEAVTVKMVPLLIQQPPRTRKLPQPQSRMERLLSKVSRLVAHQ